MPFPDNFNHSEHLIDVVKKLHNREVANHFKSVEIDSIATDKQSLRTACTVYEGDSVPEIAVKMNLFYIICRRAQDMQAPIYGTPIPGYDQEVKYKPQIHLYFRESFLDVEDGYRPIEGKIAVRLMHETTESIAMTELTRYGQKIKQLFGANNGFIWHKGRVFCFYQDRSKGYKLHILARDEAEGKRVIEQVLDIQSHAPDWQYLHVSENKEPSQAYPTVPRQERILGKLRRLPRRRPIGAVKFRYAACYVHGLGNPVIIYDRSNSKRNVLVRN